MEGPRFASEGLPTGSRLGFGCNENDASINQLDGPEQGPRSYTRFPIILNDRWRVSFDELQWILEKRRSGTRWRGSAYCVTRSALLRNIRERCGDADPDALAEVKALPDWHPDRTRGVP
jgi:hypothetical protein